MDGEREKFEAWYETCGHTFSEHYIRDFAFKAWEAARASIPSAQPSDVVLPHVQLDKFYPHLPDESEVELFVDAARVRNMRAVNGGYMIKIIALNPKAALTTQQAQSVQKLVEWYPIETIPHDGGFYRVCCAYDSLPHETVISFDEQDGYWCEIDHQRRRGAIGRRNELKPWTHWQFVSPHPNKALAPFTATKE